MNLSDYLTKQYGPTMGLAEIAVVTKRSLPTLRNNISAGQFPVPTFRVMGRRVAMTEDVAAYLTACQQEHRA